MAINDVYNTVPAKEKLSTAGKPLLAVLSQPGGNSYQALTAWSSRTAKQKAQDVLKGNTPEAVLALWRWGQVVVPLLMPVVCRDGSDHFEPLKRAVAYFKDTVADVLVVALQAQHGRYILWINLTRDIWDDGFLELLRFRSLDLVKMVESTLNHPPSLSRPPVSYDDLLDATMGDSGLGHWMINSTEFQELATSMGDIIRQVAYSGSGSLPLATAENDSTTGEVVDMETDAAPVTAEGQDSEERAEPTRLASTENITTVFHRDPEDFSEMAALLRGSCFSRKSQSKAKAALRDMVVQETRLEATGLINYSRPIHLQICKNSCPCRCLSTPGD